VGFGLAVGLPAFAAEGARTTLTPNQALELLKEGNRSFRTDSPVRAGQGRERRLEIARGQTPFAILVSCSDSRKRRPQATALRCGVVG
jgi:carbonic anhydrase